jgi:hypothetical protein
MKELDLYLDYLNEQNIPSVAASINPTKIGGTIGQDIGKKLKGDKHLQTTNSNDEEGEPLFDQEEL